MQIEEIIVQVERVVRIGLTVVLTYLVALWIAAIWWTFQDIRARSNDVALQIAATLLVIAFNFPGLLVYMMLRPRRTLAELHAEALEEEALLRSLNDTTCPSCGEAVETEFQFCPWCQARIRQTCQRCERPIMLGWRICPYCGAPALVTTASAARQESVVRGNEPSQEPFSRAPDALPSIEAASTSRPAAVS